VADRTSWPIEVEPFVSIGSLEGEVRRGRTDGSPSGSPESSERPSWSVGRRPRALSPVQASATSWYRWRGSGSRTCPSSSRPSDRLEIVGFVRPIADEAAWCCRGRSPASP